MPRRTRRRMAGRVEEAEHKKRAKQLRCVTRDIRQMQRSRDMHV